MLRKSEVQDDIAVNGTANVYGNSFSLNNLEAAAATFQATSDGTVNVDIYLHQSYQRPTTEGSADTSYVLVESGSKLLTLSDTNVHNIALSPIALEFGRFYIDGQTGNDATTKVSWKLSKQERED